MHDHPDSKTGNSTPPKSLLPDTALEPHQYNGVLDAGAGDLVHRPAQATNSPYLFLCGSVVKESACSAADIGSISGSGRSPGKVNGNPLQYLAWKISWTQEACRLQSLGS